MEKLGEVTRLRNAKHLHLVAARRRIVDPQRKSEEAIRAEVFTARA
jgi:hypothetical protein